MASEASNPQGSPSWGLVLVRVVSGGILIGTGWSKVHGGVSDELVTGTRAAFDQAPDFIRRWGESVVLPHPWIFAHLIAWGELLGGLGLFLGALTRPAGVLLAFMFANFYFAGPESARNLVMLLCACCLGCALSRAGRKCGADALLDSQLPRWMTW